MGMWARARTARLGPRQRGGQRKQSKVVEKSLDPVFNEEMDETFDGLAQLPTTSVDEPNGASEIDIPKWTANERAQIQLTLH